MAGKKVATTQRSTNDTLKMWSPRELEELIDTRARIIVNERRRELLNDTGMYVVDGRVDMWKVGHENHARIDSSRIDDLLAHACENGQRVKVVIITDEKLIDKLEGGQ